MNAARYPVYIISKGRSDCCYTADFMERDKTPFRLVVEPHEAELYAARYGSERLLLLPFDNLGLGSVPARNWVWEHSREAGAERHWIFDDNIRVMRRLWKGQRIPVNSNIALHAAETFTDRYLNIALTGFNYQMFVPDITRLPMYLNVHVYSGLLIHNDLPYRWRGLYNEDTDLCLQVLANGWCTVLINVFMIDKIKTLLMKGGNSDLYQADGRLKMARSLERMWPGVVTTTRRFKRPQHSIRNQWRGFDTSLQRRPDIDWDALGVDEMGMKLVQVAPEIRNSTLRDLHDEHGDK